MAQIPVSVSCTQQLHRAGASLVCLYSMNLDEPNQVLELREKGLSTKVIALANAAWIRFMTGKLGGDAILGVSVCICHGAAVHTYIVDSFGASLLLACGALVLWCLWCWRALLVVLIRPGVGWNGCRCGRGCPPDNLTIRTVCQVFFAILT